MGMAASQARFLGLTARKNNIEYEGQQINQQRTALGNRSADCYGQMLGRTMPLMPTIDNYTKVVYTFNDGPLTNTITTLTALSGSNGTIQVLVPGSNPASYNEIPSTYNLSYLQEYNDDHSLISAGLAIVTQYSASSGSTPAVYKVGTQVLKELAPDDWDFEDDNKYNGITIKFDEDKKVYYTDSSVAEEVQDVNGDPYKKFFTAGTGTGTTLTGGDIDVAASFRKAAETTAASDITTAFESFVLNLRPLMVTAISENPRSSAAVAAQSALDAFEMRSTSGQLPLAVTSYADSSSSAAGIYNNGIATAGDSITGWDTTLTTFRTALNAYKINSTDSTITTAYASLDYEDKYLCLPKEAELLPAFWNGLDGDKIALLSNYQRTAAGDLIRDPNTGEPQLKSMKQKLNDFITALGAMDAAYGVPLGSNPANPDEFTLRGMIADLNLSFKETLRDYDQNNLNWDTDPTSDSYDKLDTAQQKVLFNDIASKIDTFMAAFKTMVNPVWDYVNGDEYLNSLGSEQLKTLLEEQKQQKEFLDMQYGTSQNGWLVRYIHDDATDTWRPVFYNNDDLINNTTFDATTKNSNVSVKSYTFGTEKKQDEIRNIRAVIERDSTGRLINVQFYKQIFDKSGVPVLDPSGKNTWEQDGSKHALTVNTVIDQAAYDDAMNQYRYEKFKYDQEISEIQAQIDIIQKEDKNLELHLKQLDTEQEAISTEMDSVSKVIEKNIEGTFKTFG